MGKKRYNWKARQVVKTIVDDSTTNQIRVDLDVKGHYDKSNELVLPSEKRKTKIKEDKTKITRILSKKQRKRLEKIVDKKKKKENRATLLESIQKVQATSEELSQLTSIASVQTKGLKRYLQESNPDKIKFKTESVAPKEVKLNSISGSKRKKLLQEHSIPEKRFKSNDPNVVGLESDSEELSESDDDIKRTIQQVDDNDEKEVIEDNAIKEELNVSNENDDTEVIVTEMKPTVIEIKDDDTKNKPKFVERKPAVYVDVIRNEEIQAARLKLPILAEEQQIMEIINENSIIIIAGETGSGKTTQVPQFLYEAGYALKKQIGITEPRRVAAISMSHRVAEEMNLSTKEVSYLIRFEGNVTDDTKIKFMTDGVLLKEMQTDFLLTKYSVLILDEAHERSVYTDILIGLLSRIVPLRNKKGDPLKLIIMSATLRLADFTENQRLFKVTPPVIKVEARQFPVTIHFNKKTNENYLKEAFSKTVKIHTKLPEGGILIFVTGQQEVNYLMKKLRKAFPLKHKDKMLEKEKEIGAEDDESDDEHDDFDGRKNKRKRLKKQKIKIIPDINLDDYSLPNDTETLSDDDEEGGNLSSDEEDFINDVTVYQNAQPLWTLPLYSMLPSHKQQKVFKPPPVGCRLCIVSTNVAETSLTIPNVKYVVDCGKAKVKLYDKVTGLTSHVVHWTSKASANQRAGRAGRTGPGHCYRLYSSAIFNDVFQDFSIPEIRQKPVDDLYLQMKCMNIDKIINFPFPTAPDLLQLKMAQRRLEVIGALKNNQVTPLGKAISKFPVLPRFGKMLALSHQRDLLPYTICLVAALSVQEVLLETPITKSSPEEQKELRQKWAMLRVQWAGQGNSLLLGDNCVLLRAVGAAEYANSEGKLQEFCDKNGLRHKAVTEIRKLRLQLTSEIKKNMPELDIIVDPKMAPPTDLQAKLLRQILLAGMGDQIARKVSLEEVKENEDKAKFKYAYRANDMEEPVFLHNSSVLRKTLPEFVIYQEIYETNKIYMRGVTAIESDWLPIYVPELCNLSEPLAEPPPFYNEKTGKVYCYTTGTFGPQGWPLQQIEVPYPDTADQYKWFAIFLLEGRVFKKLKQYAKNLLSQPGVMIKTWARLQPRTEVLLKALMSKKINSKTLLEQEWKANPKYLLQQYQKWLPESAQSEIALSWPPFDK
ncbi:hypothetical protein GWI33_003218 [Rhynchophorus ferrugineus]|uniref:RNA helicase n=1 Tax=Rhynchophorus ferrugineus TaxID=354439 RepID=A0A834MF57_RHYFE|nr:hypothetical protein GWI33_003218 [Rhynchophorus ferrugineus]